MTRLPIRWKFALWAAALVGIVLVVYSGGTLLNLYREQLESVDLELDAHKKHILSLPNEALLRQAPEELLRYEPWTAIAVFDAQGRIVGRSRRLPEKLARGAVTESTIHTARAADGQAWRLTSFRHGDRTLVVAQTLEEVSEIMEDLILSYALSLPLVLLIAGFGGWWVAGRAMRPLRALTAAAENIRADRPEWRVPADPSAARDEIQRLTGVLNDMLTRLQHGYQQSQRFAADASHELRTPLTIMNGEIDRLMRFPALHPTVEEKLLSLQEEMLRLDRITEHLLLLTRFDAGNVTMQRQPVNLSKLVSTACEDAELLGSAQQITLSSTVAPNVTVDADGAHLRRAVLALLDNAVRYNHANGEIVCTLNCRERLAELRVRNTGPGVPEKARPQLFQRFFRVDPARARGGHGLGLSLAREIARAHGGDVVLAEQADARWTEFVLTLPLLAGGDT